MRTFVSGIGRIGILVIAITCSSALAGGPERPTEAERERSLERGLTQLRQAGETADAGRRKVLLDGAEAALREFVGEGEEHPRLAEAQLRLGRILEGKGRRAIWAAALAETDRERSRAQAEARKWLTEAQPRLDDARERYGVAFSKYPVFVSPDDEEAFRARSVAEVNYIKSQLEAADCRYRMAQALDGDERDAALEEAAADFHEIHRKYRSQVGGLYGRLWHARCRHAMGDVDRALEAYEALLDHPARSPAMKRLRGRTMWFRLMALNDAQRRDYRQVIDVADDWLGDLEEADLQREVGLGIRLERARAAYRIAAGTDVDDRERRRLGQQVTDDFRFIANATPGSPEVSVRARFLGREIRAARGEND